MRNVLALSAAAFVLLAVSGSVATAAPRLVLSASAVTAGPIAPGANGPVKTVEAQNSGDGSLSLTATASNTWLSATVGPATACTVLTGTCNVVSITLSTASLAAGTYTEFITLTDPKAIDSPQQIAVTVTIAGVPDTLTFYVGPAGSGLSASYTYIYPASTISGAVTTATGGNWLIFSPRAQSIINLPDTVQVNALNGQAAGTYTGSIVITGSSRASDNKTIKVTLVVSAAPVIDTSKITTAAITTYPGGKNTTYVAFTATAPGVGLFAGSSGGGTLNITGASATASFLSAAVYSSTLISITADATGLAAGVYHGNVTITSNAANNAAVSVPVDVFVNASGAVSINSGGIVNPVTFVAEPFAPGEVITIFGSQMAPAGTAAQNPGLPPLATTLAGTQVLVNGTPAPLFYVSPAQINFQVAYSLTAGQTASVQVVANGVPGNIRPITIATTSPRILTWLGGYGIVVNNADYSLVLPSSIAVPPYATHPAKPGDVLTIYAVGFGQTTPPAVEGIAATASPLQNAPPTSVVFGGLTTGSPVTAVPLFSGLSPTQVGLYQINVTIPAGVPLSATLPVTVTVGNAASNVFNLAVSADGK